MNKGFTLAELLIALAILGVIATFTIPKVLSSQQDTKFKSVAKEVAGMISGAYSAYQQNNTANAATNGGDLTPFMNYVKVDTTSTIDREYNAGTLTCSATYPCLRLHNGAVLSYVPGEAFAHTAATSSIYFFVDPDGVSNASTTGPGKSVVFFLYVGGRMTTWGQVAPNTYTCGGVCTWNPDPTRDPPWFSWN